MILILSSSKDRTTQRVCKWLVHLEKDFLVVHEEDLLRIESITKDDVLLKIVDRDIVFSLRVCTSYWYRRDNFSVLSEVNVNNEELKRFVAQNLGADLTTAIEYMHFLLSEKKSIASIFNANVNKLHVLNLAERFALKVPEFVYTGSKKVIGEFREQYKDVIFKTPSPGVRNPFTEFEVLSLTKSLTDEVYNKLPENFGYTFFQQQVHKKFEIRTFYLCGKFYSIALISQQNDKTKVDYRNYDYDFPNRSVPFRLKEEDEKKAAQLIDALKLDTCSIDWMYTEDGELYFLEINPVGQFGNVSYHRNDLLEKEIALYLN